MGSLFQELEVYKNLCKPEQRLERGISGIPEGLNHIRTSIYGFCFLLPLSGVGSSQEIVQKLLVKANVCTPPTPMHVSTIRSLFFYIIPKKSWYLRLLSCVAGISLNNQANFKCCSVLKLIHQIENLQNKYSKLINMEKSKAIFFFLDLISLESIPSHSPNMSVSIQWKFFAIYLVFMYLLLGQTLSS